MYCESKIDHTYFGDVEHIQPKSKFPQLQFEWENLGYVCAQCNKRKGDKFDSRLPYVNPYVDEPAEHFYVFGEFLWHRPGSERGELTIIDIELNRSDLVEHRYERLKLIKRALDASALKHNERLRESALAEIIKEADPSAEYSVFVKSMLVASGILEPKAGPAGISMPRDPSIAGRQTL